MLETTSMINGMIFSILIYFEATESFISPRELTRSKLMEIKQQHFDLVKLASGISQWVWLLVLDCALDLGVFITKVSLYTTLLGS